MQWFEHPQTIEKYSFKVYSLFCPRTRRSLTMSHRLKDIDNSRLIEIQPCEVKLTIAYVNMKAIIKCTYLGI